MRASFSERLTGRLIAWRWPLLAVAVVAALVALRPSGDLDFDRSLENMFAADDPLLVSYRRLQRTFGASEIVLAAYTDPDLMTPDGLERVRGVSKQLAVVAGVDAVLALHSPIGPKIIDLESERAGRFRDLFEGYTHGADGRTAVVVCMLRRETAAPVNRAETVAGIRRVVAPLPDGTVAGEPVMVVDGFDYIEEDGVKLGHSSTLLLMAVIALVFRSLRWVLIPLAVVQWALLVTRAVLVVGGFRLSMVSSMLTAIVTVVGVATVMHVIVRFRDARAAGLAPVEALARCGTLLAVPIIWACATDAAGFASLLVARVGPVQDFGVMMALGSLLVVPAVALIVPGLALAGRYDADPRPAWGEARLSGQLQWLLRATTGRPRRMLIAVLVVVGVLAAGSVHLDVETDFTRNFRRDSPIVRSYQFVEGRLGGAGVWDVILPAPKHPDWAYVKKVLRLERRLRAEVPGLSKTLSLADAVEAGLIVDPDDLGGTLLANAQVYGETKMMKETMPEFYRALFGPDPRDDGRYFMRIMLRGAPERQSAREKQAMIEAVERISREEFPESEVTGYLVLLTSLISSMLRDQWIAFAVALAAIGLMMLAAFRRPAYAVAAALVPNALPVVVVTGLLGWTSWVGGDVKINMGAAMIAAVSLGLSIDSSIHYLFAYRRARAAGLDVSAALAEVQSTVGRAVVLSTLALVVGFATLATSQFVPTIYFGVLVSLTMLGGLAGNLVILPLLVYLIDGGATVEAVSDALHS